MGRRLFAFLACALAACGIDVQGQGEGDDGQGPPPAATSDGGAGDALGALVTDAPAEAAPSESGSSACECGLPSAPGFTPVAFTPDRSAGCPDAFTTLDVVSEPSAGAGACTCGSCTITAAPSCVDATFTTKYDNSMSATCGAQSSVDHTGNGGVCTSFNGALAEHATAVVLAPSAGACSVAVTADTTAVSTKKARACAPNGATCACDPSLPTAFKTCLRAQGDVTCPPQAPTKHLTGASVNVACGACGCTLSATCSSSAVTFYADSSCTNRIATVGDTSCASIGGGSYGSYTWRSTTSAPTCLVGSAPAGVASLVDVATICCP